MPLDSKKLHACPHCCKKHFKKKGTYYRRISKTYIPRYYCFECKKNFSTRTLAITFRQKRPDLNRQIRDHVNSGASMRRTAKVLKCNYLTVYRKVLWLSERAKLEHQKKEFTVKELQFDEMESIEHTKLKPVTIALAVSEDFKLLGVKVGRIPAKGYLSEISRKKYGPRPDESLKTIRELLGNIKLKNKNFIIKSDAKPSYKRAVKEYFPNQSYEVYASKANKEKKREMKYLNLEKRVYDPLFAINQRMAKFRDHIKRLTRRSWCTTKKIENLEKHIYLYMADNNGYELI